MSQSQIPFKEWGKEFLPGYMGIEIINIEKSHAHAELDIKQHHLAPNGYLHAGTVIALADTVAGYGCMASLPPGAKSFTTIEVKTNYLGTARDGRIKALGKLVHGGRTTQVWDVEVSNLSNNKVIALFRCTQYILYPS